MFCFSGTTTAESYTLSLHDALPIFTAVLDVDRNGRTLAHAQRRPRDRAVVGEHPHGRVADRSEEHTSELQSRLHLVCRLLAEKKKRRRPAPRHRPRPPALLPPAHTG